MVQMVPKGWPADQRAWRALGAGILPQIRQITTGSPSEQPSLTTVLLSQISPSPTGKLSDSWTANDRARRAASYLASRLSELFWVIALFFACELIIWGFYTGLKKENVEFLSSIFGMAAISLFMLLVCWLVPGLEALYAKYVRSKVDFINQNLGVGFPVPMVIFTNKEQIHNVGPIFGNFFATMGVFWLAIFLISWAAVIVPTLKTRAKNQAAELEQGGGEKSKPTSMAPSSMHMPSHPASRAPTLSEAPILGPEGNRDCPHSTATSITAVELPSPSRFRGFAPLILTALFALVAGLPLSYAINEDRPLDFAILWLSWVASVKGQVALRQLSFPWVPRDVTRIIATLVNPVLMTTFIMAGYTRLKVSARRIPLDDIIKAFSNGTTIAQLWSGDAMDSSPFGAGDAALSLLEVGIVVWGFKLHECRRQLFSVSGILVVAISFLCGAFSAFVSVLMARAMTISGEASLAFASRSTTLALAKPSTTSLGGSEMINACLVVGNGIFGQILGPWIIRGLRVRDQCNDSQDCRDGRGVEDGDTAVEVAAGAAVGMNGAAMGVSYLYERRSRAAPYAALSMTAFGVATTVLSSVGPFQVALQKVAGI